VALRLTSDQPVRASPLQLSFDAKLLEAVAVRPEGSSATQLYLPRQSRRSIFVARPDGRRGADANS